ncbi:MAG: rhomboid family intramembrane serine protease [Planctomycetota bacterium]|nr:rhomboid family intramembrane serine protease [Planctomycetota bacterium]
MGIYDRDYYRGDSRGVGRLFSTSPATTAIIGINVAVFFLQGLGGADVRLLHEWFAASVDGVVHHGRVWQLLTAAFLHNPHDIFHILWNMVFLWMVGREMEAFHGSRDFVMMYLGAAIFSTACWLGVDAFSARGHQMIGASGAVTAVVVLYTLYYPRREILLFFVIPVEMWIAVLLFLGLDALRLIQGVPVQEAVVAHLGGALFGWLFKTFDWRWSRLGVDAWPSAVRKAWTRRHLRVVSPPRNDYEPPRLREPSGPSWTSEPGVAAARPVTAPTVMPVIPEEQLEARLDEILAKIAREGRAALNDDENRLLLEASRRARGKLGGRPR